MSADKHMLKPPTQDEIFAKSRVASEIELGMLQMQILWILNRNATHGYDIMKRMKTLKSTKVTQGTLYPTLQRLLDLGLISKKNEDRRIVYRITAKGKRILNAACTDFTRTFFGIFHDFVCEKCVSR